MCSCHSILECCVTFSGVKLSIRSFVLLHMRHCLVMLFPTTLGSMFATVLHLQQLVHSHNFHNLLFIISRRILISFDPLLHCWAIIVVLLCGQSRRQYKKRDGLIGIYQSIFNLEDTEHNNCN